MSSTNYLQKLSDEQYNAIVKEGNVLLTAIPGSGKTRTLTNKVLYEFDEQETPEARCSHYCDKIEADLQAKIYQDKGMHYTSYSSNLLH